MAGVNILDLVEATEVNETTDYLAVVDTSDTTQDTSGSTKKITVGNFLSGMLDWFYPVGTIYETTSSDLDTVAKMNAHFGGTWEAYGSGRVLVGKSTDAEFNALGKTGGAKTHTLTTAEMPSHSHTVTQNFTRFASTGSNVPTVAGTIHLSSVGSAFDNIDRIITSSGSGSGSAHNNLQPYIVVYRYRRIS